MIMLLPNETDKINVKPEPPIAVTIDAFNADNKDDIVE